MQDRNRLRERFDEQLWQWADAAAQVKSAVDGVETSIRGVLAPIWSSVLVTSELASR